MVRTLRGARGHIAVALIVCLACAGTATAARLITGADVKDASLTGRDVRDRSLTPRDFRGSVRGPRGIQGPQGIQGAPGTPGAPGSPGAAGSALAYAKVTLEMVEGEPIYNVGASKNVNGVSRTGNAANPATAIPGIVCIDTSVGVNVAVASPERLPVDPTVIANVQLPTVNGADRCPGGTDAAVLLKDLGDAPVESSFFVIFN